MTALRKELMSVDDGVLRLDPPGIELTVGELFPT